MTCTKYGAAIVCSTPSTRYRKIIACPVCKCRRRFTRTFGGWYGDWLQCCGCGNEWSDGYRMTRLRTEAAKTKAKAAARKAWVEARPADEYRAAMDEFRAIYCTRSQEP